MSGSLFIYNILVNLLLEYDGGKSCCKLQGIHSLKVVAISKICQRQIIVDFQVQLGRYNYSWLQIMNSTVSWTCSASLHEQFMPFHILLWEQGCLFCFCFILYKPLCQILILKQQSHRSLSSHHGNYWEYSELKFTHLEEPRLRKLPYEPYSELTHNMFQAAGILKNLKCSR